MARIFLSYSSEHFALAERVAASLRGDGHAVFFDREALPASSNFHGVIRRDIRRAGLMVFLVSPQSVRPGSYARAELKIAQREWKTARRRVVPMMVEPTAYEAMPGFLREVTVLEPEGDPVGELTHAVDLVLRNARRRLLLKLAAGLSLFTLALLVGLAVPWVVDAVTSSGEEEPTEPDSPAKSDVSSPVEPSPRPVPRPIPIPVPVEIATVELPDGTRLQLNQVPGGRFTMGAPPSQQSGHLAEPQREVQVDSLWIGETEVTQGQWQAVMGFEPSHCSYGCLASHPVNRVSHHDALRFLNRLSELEGLDPCYYPLGGRWNPVRGCQGYRLPTEAEWEYAARAGTTAQFVGGDDPRELCRYGNGRDLARIRRVGRTDRGALSCDDGFANYAPVKSFLPNRFGLYDMQGNAWEWVWERSPHDDSRRIIRGGSFLDKAEGLRVANRSHRYADRGMFSIGFRIARND